jgi:hypothetical protein
MNYGNEISKTQLHYVKSDNFIEDKRKETQSVKGEEIASYIFMYE